MDDIRVYLMSVCGAAIICSIAGKFFGGKSSIGIIKIMCGLFMTITLLRPVHNLRINGISQIGYDIEYQASQAIRQGEQETENALKNIIKEKTETYILQKAQLLQADITVEVYVTADTVPTPEKVYLSGSIGPYARQQLQNTIAQDLGISKENQIWK